MPRQGRLDAPGAVHHVMTRGHERARIFRDRADHLHFLDRLTAALARTKTRCLAWALMPNHIHLVLETGSRPLAKVLHGVFGGYAIAFNNKWKRTGHLFEGRYKSLLCEKEAYLLELVRYVHLNPVRAGVVESLAGLSRYPWSGHRSLIGLSPQPWQEIDEVLKRFGKGTAAARSAYLAFCEKGLQSQADAKEQEPGFKHLIEGGWEQEGGEKKNDARADERVLGSGSFVEKALRRTEEQERWRSRARRAGVTMDAVIRKVAEATDVPFAAMNGPNKIPARVRARALACYWLVERLGWTEVAVARRLGLTQSAVSRGIVRGEALAPSVRISFPGVDTSPPRKA